MWIGLYIYIYICVLGDSQINRGPESQSGFCEFIEF